MDYAFQCLINRLSDKFIYRDIRSFKVVVYFFKQSAADHKKMGPQPGPLFFCVWVTKLLVYKTRDQNIFTIPDPD